MQYGPRKNSTFMGARFRHYCVAALLTLIVLWLISHIILGTQSPAYYMLDVGQGDCGLVIYEHKAWMIDGGGLRNKQGANVGVDVIIPFLAAQGIHDIEGAFISHFHFDHVKGIMEVGEHIPIRSLYINQRKMDFFRGDSMRFLNNDGYDMLQAIKKWQETYKIPVYGMKQGDRMEYKEMQLTCVTPDAKVMDDVNENNQSLILKLSIYNTTVLFTGDMEKEQEALGTFPDIDILKIAHHGSSTSTTTAFLEQTTPELALISVGDNVYGHPSIEVLARLKDKGIASFSTQDYGMLKITFNKKGYQLVPYK